MAPRPVVPMPVLGAVRPLEVDEIRALVGLPVRNRPGGDTVGHVKAAWETGGKVYAVHSAPDPCSPSSSPPPPPPPSIETTPVRAEEKKRAHLPVRFVPPPLGVRICEPTEYIHPPRAKEDVRTAEVPIGTLLTHVTSTTGGRVWKSQWKQAMNMYWQPFCSFCDNSIESRGGVGAHVSSPRFAGIGIVPCCTRCNSNPAKTVKIQPTVRETTFVFVDSAEIDRIERNQRASIVHYAKVASAANPAPTSVPEEEQSTGKAAREPESVQPPSNELKCGKGVCERQGCGTPVCKSGVCGGGSERYCCLHCFCKLCKVKRH